MSWASARPVPRAARAPGDSLSLTPAFSRRERGQACAVSQSETKQEGGPLSLRERVRERERCQMPSATRRLVLPGAPGDSLSLTPALSRRERGQACAFLKAKRSKKAVPSPFGRGLG